MRGALLSLLLTLSACAPGQYAFLSEVEVQPVERTVEHSLDEADALGRLHRWAALSFGETPDAGPRTVVGRGFVEVDGGRALYVVVADVEEAEATIVARVEDFQHERPGIAGDWGRAEVYREQVGAAMRRAVDGAAAALSE